MFEQENKSGLTRALTVEQSEKLDSQQTSSAFELFLFRLVVLFRRLIVRTWHLIERTPPFLRVAFSREGLGCRDGWILLWGKLRRFVITLFPPLVRHLQQRYGLTGGCTSCGASCRMFNQCVHWDEQTNLCKVYEDRPNICRTFPITPADIRDRNITLKGKPCGFTFTKK